MADLPGETQVKDAMGTGQNAINNFDPTSTANSVRSGFDTLTNNQLGGARNYMSEYAGAIAKNPSVPQLYNSANEQFGVQPLAQRANYLNTQVTNAVPNAYNTARGFDYSEPQVENAVNTNLRFLQPQATAATNAAQTAQTLAGQAVGYGVQQNQTNLLPVQSYGSFLGDAYARQATGYTTAAQSQMEGLIAKVNAGVQLSSTEMSTLASLQASKNSYDAQIAGANASQNVAKIGASNMILPPGSTYYNAQTGQAYNPFTKVPSR